MTLPTTGQISIGDVNAEVGVPFTTQHGLDWVFEITRPANRPAASGFTPVNISDPVNGGTIDIANSNLGYYQTSPGTGLVGTGDGWAYYNNLAYNAVCTVPGACNDCSGANCGDHNCVNCTAELLNCGYPDTQSWLQPNCNCACNFNCNQIVYSVNCNCNCPWLCACACW